MSRAVAFLAGMGTGYLDAKDKQIERDRQAAKDKREQDAFDMQKKTFDQTQADKATLRAAGQPVGVTPEQGPPTEAQYAATPAGQEPDAIGYMVGSGPTARDFATRGLADASAAPQNTPQGTQSRQVAALQATGDYAGAQKLRSETAKATEEEQKIADSTVRRSISGLKTHDDITQYMTDSPADKSGGQFSAKAVKGADGMIDYMQVLPDGTLKSTGQRFTDDAAGIEKARQTLAGYMTPEQRIAQAQHDVTNALAARKETSESAERTAKVGYYDSLSGKADKWEPGGGKPKGSTVDRMSEIDKTTLVNINKQRDVIHAAIVKGQAEGSFDPASPGAKALTTQMAALGLKEGQIHARYADTESAPDPAGIRKPAPAGRATGNPQQYPINDSDRPMILASELKSAQARLAAGDARAQGDITALTQEISRLPRGSAQPAPTTPKTLASSGVSAPASVAPPLQQAAPAPVARPPAQAAPALAVKGVQAPMANYDNWMAAKSAKDELLSVASKMSPDRRELYLRSRLPQIEQAIQFNQSYKTY